MRTCGRLQIQQDPHAISPSFQRLAGDDRQSLRKSLGWRDGADHFTHYEAGVGQPSLRGHDRDVPGNVFGVGGDGQYDGEFCLM